MRTTPLTKLALDAIKLDLEQFLRTATSVRQCMEFACALEDMADEVRVMRRAVQLKSAQLLEEAERVALLA